MRFPLACLVFAALATACGSSTPDPQPTATPPTAEPAASPPHGSTACAPPAAGEAMTPEQCTCQGGRVNLSRGGGEQPHCNANEQELGTVRLGIEGGWCCK